MIKDHRTDYEVGNVQPVMDGELDGFIKAYLMNEKEWDKVKKALMQSVLLKKHPIYKYEPTDILVTPYPKMSRY